MVFKISAFLFILSTFNFRRVPEYRQVEVEVPVYEKRCCVGYRGDECLERDEMAANTPAPLVEDQNGETTCDVVDTCVAGKA